MKQPVRPCIKTCMSTSMIMLSAIALEGNAQTFSGSYRPVDSNTQQLPSNTDSDSRFAPQASAPQADALSPSSNQGRQPMPGYAPSVWQQPAYYPAPVPAYPTEKSTPNYNVNLNPMGIIDDFFGSGSNRNANSAYVYPSALPPTYAPPSYNILPTYGQMPTSAPSGYHPETAVDTPVDTPSGNASTSWNPPASATHESMRPATDPTPRPYANPQESGNSFMQRPWSSVNGAHDSRFRPPELKGTP